MPEALHQTLERTGFRASLTEEYTLGHAPQTQRKDRHVAPERPTYYDLPPIKKPTWLWFIPAYFFVGGLASGAYVAATLLDVIGRPEDRPLVRAGRLLALAGMLLSPLLLIADLGRPERWHHMLRVFRPRSMMNLGSWGITIFGLFTGLAVAVDVLQALASRSVAARLVALPLRIASWVGLIPAVFAGSYTGLLLTATNVALWAGNKLLMGPLFFTSALSTGVAATGLLARLLGPARRPSQDRVKRAESVLLAAELALTAGSALALRGLARPLLVGRWARRYQVVSLGLGVLLPLLLHRLGVGRTLASFLVLLGGAVMRVAVVEAGKESADDPRAYFDFTRAG